MPTNWNTLPIKFEGGWRTDLGRLEQGLQAPGSAAQLINYENSTEGGYTRIQGFGKFSDTEVSGSGNVIGVISISPTECLARRGNEYFYSSGTTWTSKGTAPTGGATRIRWDIYNFDGNEHIVIVDGVEDPFLYDTVSDTGAFDTNAPAEVIGAYDVKLHKNHLFFAKDNILTFTAPFTDTDYATGNGAGSINIGDTIVGLVVFREQLIVFCANSIYRITGSTSSDFVLRSITKSTGCLSRDTIQEVGGDILYLGPDGVRFLSATERNEDFGLERASKKIQSEIINIIQSGRQYASTVVRPKSQYRLFVWDSNLPTELSEGFIATKFSEQSTDNIAWSKIQGMKVYDTHSRQYTDRETILFCSDTNYIYQMESGSDFDGTPMVYLFETPYIPIEDPRIRSTIYKHHLYTSLTGAFNLACQIRYNYNETGYVQPPEFILDGTSGQGAIWGQFVWGGANWSASQEQTFSNQVTGSGFNFSLRYFGEDSNPPFTLDYALLEVMKNERR